jgi:hypothetical protein
MVTDGPSQIADIRLLIGGKFVENSKTLAGERSEVAPRPKQSEHVSPHVVMADYSMQMGDTGSTVTIHCLIRKAAAAPQAAKKGETCTL